MNDDAFFSNIDFEAQVDQVVARHQRGKARALPPRQRHIIAAVSVTFPPRSAEHAFSPRRGLPHTWLHALLRSARSALCAAPASLLLGGSAGACGILCHSGACRARRAVLTPGRCRAPLPAHQPHRRLTLGLEADGRNALAQAQRCAVSGSPYDAAFVPGAGALPAAAPAFGAPTWPPPVHAPAAPYGSASALADWPWPAPSQAALGAAPFGGAPRSGSAGSGGGAAGARGAALGGPVPASGGSASGSGGGAAVLGPYSTAGPRLSGAAGAAPPPANGSLRASPPAPTGTAPLCMHVQLVWRPAFQRLQVVRPKALPALPQCARAPAPRPLSLYEHLLVILPGHSLGFQGGALWTTLAGRAPDARAPRRAVAAQLAAPAPLPAPSADALMRRLQAERDGLQARLDAAGGQAALLRTRAERVEREKRELQARARARALTLSRILSRRPALLRQRARAARVTRVHVGLSTPVCEHALLGIHQQHCTMRPGVQRSSCPC